MIFCYSLSELDNPDEEIFKIHDGQIIQILLFLNDIKSSKLSQVGTG